MYYDLQAKYISREFKIVLQFRCAPNNVAHGRFVRGKELNVRHSHVIRPSRVKVYNVTTLSIKRNLALLQSNAQSLTKISCSVVI